MGWGEPMRSRTKWAGVAAIGFFALAMSFIFFGLGGWPTGDRFRLWPAVALWLHLVGLILFLRWRRQELRPKPGTCPTCGYDLTGLATGAVCPECGEAP